MIIDSSKLIKGQKLFVELKEVKDRIPKKLRDAIEKNPYGILVGYKMVDGNQFGLALDFGNGITTWFFENELSVVEEE
tara:strand:+ start:1019 stop:1252 length:234 start_codon:yes stop_codon:yes gene_type:complete